MSETTTTGPAASARPKQLLRQGNSNLKRDGIWVWTLPALKAELPDGTKIVTCNQAGTCALVCYARFGTYTWSNVSAAHVANLRFVHEDLAGWDRAMRAELAHKKFEGAHIRIHDAGDFYKPEYLIAWLGIIRDFPATTFYAYTKEVLLVREHMKAKPPNLHLIFSLGGKQDRFVDRETERFGDVFADEESIAPAGFHSQAASDLLSFQGPSPVGMAAKQRPRELARQGDRTLGEWQREHDLKRGFLTAEQG